MVRRAIVFSVGLALIVTSAVAAGDLGLITLENAEQERAAKAVIDFAYHRQGNQFLVSLDPVAAPVLDQAGISFELLIPGADLSALHLVIPDHDADINDAALRTFGRAIALGDIRLMSLSQAAAATLNAEGLMTVPLARYRLRLLWLPPAATSAIEADYPADSLALLVNADSLQYFNERLEAFYTRYTGTDSLQRARDWLVQKFLDWGYTDVTTQDFNYGGATYQNVKCVKLGLMEPDKLIVIGGHYDSRSNSNPTIHAPGADDNASGTAMTLELARILKDLPLRKTVIFMPFSAEEQGLVGSLAAARDFAANDARIEIMYNFDMVGFTADSYWDIKLMSGFNEAHRDFMAAAATRISSLIPIFATASGNSDHASFLGQGYHAIFTHEADFNTPNYHQASDSTTKMNFPYMTEVARMSVVATAIAAESPYPVTAEGIIDMGDGQAIDVHWSDCAPDVSYHVYWGESSGDYTDSAIASASDCHLLVTGLAEGLIYYFSVVGETTDGYRAHYSIEGNQVSLVIPRVPLGLGGRAGMNQIEVTWQANHEADLSHYRLYRQIGQIGPYVLYQDHLIDTLLIDDHLSDMVNYGYRVSAVDVDGNESVLSEPVVQFPASFAGGPVVIDAWSSEQTYWPDQAEQEAYLDSLFGETSFQLIVADQSEDRLARGDIGRFSSLFWIDDDVTTKTLSSSDSTIAWYLNNPTNMLVSGYQVVQTWLSTPDIPADHLLNQQFGVTAYLSRSWSDFIGATGQNGWPSIEMDISRHASGWNGVPIFTLEPGAEVIYTYNTNLDPTQDDPKFGGEPCGVLYDTPNGKRIVFGFPIWFMTPESMQALIAKALAEFGGSEQTFVNGDLDDSGTIDILDLIILIEHLFVYLDPLANPAAAEMDGTPPIDISDASYLIGFLFMDGPAPISTP